MNVDNLTENEWHMIFLLERLRGLSLKEIAEWLECDIRKLGVESNWIKFRDEEGPDYMEYKISTRRDLKYRTYTYLDACLEQELIPLKPEVMADVLNTDTETIKGLIDEWERDIREHKRFIRCIRCGIRGDWSNPILENKKCLLCNAEENKWPLRLWRENGQYIALLHQWGLVPSEIVSEHITRGNGDNRDSTETHRQLAGGGEYRMDRAT